MGQETTFKDFTKSWFIYDICPYVQGIIRRGGKYSRSFAELRRSQLIKYLLPCFGDYALINITPRQIEEWLFWLQSIGLSNQTINHYFSTLKLIMKDAYRLKLIPDDPTTRVRRFIAKSKKKGVLTSEEVALLFQDDAHKTIWQGQYLHYLLNLTDSETGMRVGELQALRPEKVQKDHLIVSSAWERKFGEKTTKTGTIRYVPISVELSNKLLSFSEVNKTSPYIFSEIGSYNPVDHKAIRKWFCRALINIGISKDERVERNITMHSWRHYYNSYLLMKGVPENVVRAIIGHSRDDMTQLYTNFNASELVSLCKSSKIIK